MSALGARLLAALFPPRCLSCGALTGGPTLCGDCQKGLVPVEEPACPFCGRGKGVCRCDYGEKFVFERTVSQWYYTKSGARLIQRYKFEGKRAAYDRAVGPAFEEKVLREYGGIPIDFIVPVPLYRGEERQKGFHHTGHIADSLGKRLGCPVRREALIQTRKKRPQHALNGPERAENVRGIYRSPERMECACVLLVDDIATSFSTLNECARALLAAGADRVLCAAPMTAARLPEEDEERKRRKSRLKENENGRKRN
ncbi:MAG: double zinc ribbon domain-containing protein [Oscillospiraceae bacterium]|nr:double zinc ribbon domain-containing protein [Oscillospiraceae bacterium]